MSSFKLWLFSHVTNSVLYVHSLYPLAQISGVRVRVCIDTYYTVSGDICRSAGLLHFVKSVLKTLWKHFMRKTRFPKFLEVIFVAVNLLSSVISTIVCTYRAAHAHISYTFSSYLTSHFFMLSFFIPSPSVAFRQPGRSR